MHKLSCRGLALQVSKRMLRARKNAYLSRPHKRKRKRYELSPSPTLEPTSSHTSYQRRSRMSPPVNNHTTLPMNHRLSPSRQSIGENDPSSVEAAAHSLDNGETPECAESYIGRDAYLDIPLSEDTTKAAVPANDGISEIDLQVLNLYKAFEMPPRSVRTSLIDRFMEHCLPWMPIVDRRWLEDQPDHSPSPLLLQSVFLAGSRVSSKALIGATSEDYYQRAKALFFSDHEKNPIIMIISALLLHWWNPTGPQQISASTSGFWVRIATGLAYQIGLHKEPTSGQDNSLRRRVWWTLLVCYILCVYKFLLH